MKRALYAFLIGCMLVLTAIGFAACRKPTTTQVTLVNWEDETIEVELYSDVTADNSAVYDTDGNAYATKAAVTQKDGTAVSVLDGVFRADYAGGYTIVYTLADSSVSASAKTVTVKIKGTDTPAPYFATSRLRIMENTEFAVPGHGYALDPSVAVSSETLTLYRVDGGDREKVEADLSARVTLPAGNYVFVYEVTAGDKTGSAELAFRVKIKSEQFALASLNGEGENVLGVSCWDNGIGGWMLGSAEYTSEVARNEFVSNGSAKIALPASNGAAHVYVTPEITQADFVAKMNKPGAVVSIWLYMKSENGEPRSVTCGKKGASLPNEAWTNVCVSAEDFGFKDDAAGFWTALSMGKSALFSVTNAGWDAYTVYVDSIYVAEPLTGTFESATCAFGGEVTVTAHSDQTDKFYYELLDTVDGAAPQTNADGRFTPRVAGKILAKAHPCDNGYFAEALTTVVTVTHTSSLSFGEDAYEFPYGTSTRPTASVTGGEANVSYRLDSADGSQMFSYLTNDGNIRLFEGKYTLTASAKIGDVDFVTFAELTAAAAPVQKGIVENYDSPASAQNTRWALATYMGDFKGEQGVVRYDLTGDMWPGYQLDYSLQTKEELLSQGFTENDLFAIHFYMENVPANYFILDFVYGNGQYELRYINEGWNTAYLSAGRFLDSYNQWFAPEYSGYFFFTNNNYTGPLYVYIDWIGLVKNEHGTDVAAENGAIEFDNFDHEHSTIGAAAKSTDLLVSWVPEYEGREGVMKLHTEAPYNAQPTVKGLISRLTKEQFVAKGVDASFDVFCVDVFVASEGNYTMLDGGGNTLASFNEGKKWYTAEVPVSYVLDHLDSFAFAFTDEGKAHTHEIYIDKMYFKSGLGAAIEGNKLIRRSDNTEYTYKFTVNGQSAESYVIDVENGYNLLPLAPAGSFSTDYTIVVTRYNAAGEAVGDSATLIWSSPVGENEINGFDSSASRGKFVGNAGITATFEKSVSDGTVAKSGVAKIRLNEYEWPDLKIGAPMLSKEQAAEFSGDYDFMVFTVYFTANKMEGLQIVYRHFVGDGAVDYTINVKEGWNDYTIPASYFDYDAVAAGKDFFFIVRNNEHLNDVTLYLDAIYFIHETPPAKAAAELDGNTLVLTETAVEGVTYKFTVNGKSTDGYVLGADGYELTPLAAESFSSDYEIIVQGYNGAGEKVGEAITLVWSSPAGENEINGFNSTAAQKKFVGNAGLKTTFEASLSDGIVTRNGVAKIQLNEYAWPDLKIGVPMLSKDQAAAFGGENYYVVIAAYLTASSFDGLQIVYNHFDETAEGGVIQYVMNVKEGWNDYAIPVSYFDYDAVAAGKDFFFIVRGDGSLTDVTVYLDSIHFEYREPVVEPETTFSIQDGKLTVTNPKNGITYKFTVNGKTDAGYVIDVENGFALSSLVETGSFSTGYRIVVQGYDADGEATGKASLLTWSSPAGENEINGFGSTAAQKAFIGNHTQTISFVDEMSDGTTTKYGVAKIELTGLYPDIRIGAPLLSKEQAATFNTANHYVVFVVYFASDTVDMSALTLTYHGKGGDKIFNVSSGWNEYWIPVSFFDYDEIAKGADSSHYFFPYRQEADLAGITMYIDEIRFDYKEPVTEIRLNENTLTVVNPKAGITYKFTVNGNSDNSYVVGNGFDLTAVAVAGNDSADYAIVVQGYNSDDEKVGDEMSVVWSSPAGEKEINGFGSTAAQEAFVGSSGITNEFLKSMSDGTTTKSGVVKIQLGDYEWPGVQIGAPMLSKAQAASFGGEDYYVVITAYLTADKTEGLQIVYKHLDETAPDGRLEFKMNVKAGWNDYMIPVSYFDYDAVADGSDVFYFVRNNEHLNDVTVYLDSIHFYYKEPVPEVRLNENTLGVVNPKAGITYKFTVNGNSDSNYVVGNGFDLTAVAVAGSDSADYAIVVQGYNSDGEKVGDEMSVVWSSPAGEKEINGFGSTAAQKAFIGNKTLTMAFENEVSDGATTKHGVAKIELTGSYPDLKIGVPMLSKEQTATFNTANHYVVFVVYLASDTVDMSALTLTYRGKGGDKIFNVSSGWNEYWIPVSYFDYDEVAKGSGSVHFFFPALSNLEGITMYIDEIRFDYKEPVTEIRLNENTLSVVNPKAGITYKFTVNGTADESYVIGTDGFDLTSISNGGFSTDYAIVVQGYNSDDEKVGDEMSVVWSSPAGANEINGFNSKAAQERFVGNAGLTMTFEDEVSDGTTTKYGVAKIQLNEYAWPDLKIGVPMLSKEQADRFSGDYAVVVISAYFTANNFGGLQIVYKHFDESVEGGAIQHAVNVKEGWNEYWIPVSIFDYDAVAAGKDFFFPCRNDGSLSDVTMYIDEIRFENREYLLTDTKAVFFDFNDPNALSSFATKDGNSNCTYCESSTVAEGVTLTNCIRYYGTGMWPEVSGFAAAMDKSAYEAFVQEGDKFVIEGFCNTNADNIVMSHNLDNVGAWTTIGTLPKGGSFRFEIDAQLVLSHFDDLVNGTIRIPFNNGTEIEHDVYFTGMYFEKAQA